MEVDLESQIKELVSPLMKTGFSASGWLFCRVDSLLRGLGLQCPRPTQQRSAGRIEKPTSGSADLCRDIGCARAQS